MTRFFCTVLVFLFISCNSNQTTSKKIGTDNSSSAIEQDLQISAFILSIVPTDKKFRIMAIIENETGITSFSKGDTVSLYPNFIRREGESQPDMKNTDNLYMNTLQSLAEGHLFKAQIKIQGSGKKRYGLIMKWEK